MPRQRRSQPRATIKEEPPIEDATMKEDPPMEDVKQTPDPIEFVGKTVETMALWADANQRILSQLVELGAGAAKESARLYTELQQTTIEVLRDTQATALRWQTLWPEAFKDPMRFYQQTLVESVDGAHKAFRFVEGNAQAVAHSAERWQASAEKAGKGIQETVKATMGKIKDVYGHN